MKAKKVMVVASMLAVSMLAAACAQKQEKPAASTAAETSLSVETSSPEGEASSEGETSSEAETSAAAESDVSVKSATKGQEYAKLLGKTNWQGTKVYDADGTDLTKENADFIGLAKYDAETGYYEFFDKDTGETRGDEGTYFVTNDGSKRILISATKKYQAVVDITELTDKKFTYERMGKDGDGKDVEVFVDHVPYTEKELKFTNGRAPLNAETGVIDTSRNGDAILGATLWNGTIVKDAEGNDVTSANQMFISLAKFDDLTSKYEFFDLSSGESRGDYGYFGVLDNNKIRSHVSIGSNKYGAVLEITEINDKKFTYKRMGKDLAGKDIEVFVEHEPYKGDLKPEFSF